MTTKEEDKVDEEPSLGIQLVCAKDLREGQIILLWDGSMDTVKALVRTPVPKLCLDDKNDGIKITTSNGDCIQVSSCGAMVYVVDDPPPTSLQDFLSKFRMIRLFDQVSMGDTLLTTRVGENPNGGGSKDTRLVMRTVTGIECHFHQRHGCMTNDGGSTEPQRTQGNVPLIELINDGEYPSHVQIEFDGATIESFNYTTMRLVRADISEFMDDQKEVTKLSLKRLHKAISMQKAPTEQHGLCRHYPRHYPEIMPRECRDRVCPLNYTAMLQGLVEKLTVLFRDKVVTDERRLYSDSPKKITLDESSHAVNVVVEYSVHPKNHYKWHPGLIIRYEQAEWLVDHDYEFLDDLRAAILPISLRVENWNAEKVAIGSEVCGCSWVRSIEFTVREMNEEDKREAEMDQRHRDEMDEEMDEEMKEAMDKFANDLRARFAR